MSSSLRNFSGAFIRPSAWNCHKRNNMAKIKNVLYSHQNMMISTISKGKVFESMDDVVSDICDGSRLMIGGFGSCGAPHELIEAISKKGSKDLIVISTDVRKKGLDKLLHEHKIKRIIASFVGESTDLEKQYLTGQLEVELSPQGTLVERIRAGGAGIPAFYTPTGFGTIVQEGKYIVKYDETGKPAIFIDEKPVKQFNGRGHVLETALTGDFSIVKAWKADKSGNLVFRKSAGNFNNVMCKASKVTIVEVEEILEVGQLDPDQIHIPGIYVDRIVRDSQCEKRVEFKRPKATSLNEARNRIIRRAVLEFKDGMYVNLGIGMPVMAADLIPKSMKVMIQSENGILGMGPFPTEEQLDADLVNAANHNVTIIPGASFFGSDESFAMIRGGHMDLTILGGMEVSAKGDLANWIIPKLMVKGMGGAMDLVSAESTKVVVTMEHTAKDGSPKIMTNCTLPVTGRQCVNLIITDLAVFEVNKGKGLKLIEIAANSDINEIVRSTACEFDVADNLKVMGQANTENQGNEQS